MKSLLKIGELAKLSNISQETLRYYEKKGLLTPSTRSEAGYRLYSQQSVHSIRFILSAKEVGFTLGEIRELLTLEIRKDEASCQEVKLFVEDKIKIINQRIRELQTIKKSLLQMNDSCSGSNKSATHCSILETLSKHDNCEKHPFNDNHTSMEKR